VVSFTPGLFTAGKRASGTHWIADWGASQQGAVLFKDKSEGVDETHE